MITTKSPGVNVRRVGGLVLTLENMSGLRSDATKNLVLSVDEKPIRAQLRWALRNRSSQCSSNKVTSVVFQKLLPTRGAGSYSASLSFPQTVLPKSSGPAWPAQGRFPGGKEFESQACTGLLKANFCSLYCIRALRQSSQRTDLGLCENLHVFCRIIGQTNHLKVQAAPDSALNLFVSLLGGKR